MSEEKNKFEYNEELEEKEIIKNTQNSEVDNVKDRHQKTKEKENSDLTFKRVDFQDKLKKTKKKKVCTFFKVMLFLIMLIIVAYCIFFARNCIILTEISGKMKELAKKENYSYSSITKMNGEKKNTNIKFATNNNEELFEIRIGGNIIVMWEDKKTNQRVTAFPTEKVASIISKEEMGLQLPVMKEINNKTVRALMSIASIIYTDTYQGKQCYVVMIGDAQKVWIEKETGIVQKREYGTYTIEYIDIKLDNTQIVKPDLSDYEVVEN